MQIEVRKLTKTFGSLRANDQISLTFAGGQIHGVLGENGAGKSTMMKLLAGLLRRDSGEILLDGKPATINTPRDSLESGIGMVHQEPLDVPAFTALENLYCAAPRWALPTRLKARNTLNVLCDRLGFTVDPDTRVGNLTVGQRQQLEIIRLLACGARALILDEPTTGITAAQARALFAALKRLASEGNTVLFVSHKLHEVTELCDTISVLRSGQLVGEQMPMPVPQARMLELMFGTSERGEAATETAAVSHADPSKPAQPAVWSLDRVTLREGKLELRDMVLDFQPGVVTGLAGLDGSGQQLLLRLLGGRMHPVQGVLRLNGQDVTHQGVATFLRAGVHYLPADRLHDGMIGAMSLTDHFALQDGKGLLVDQAQARKQAREAIEQYAIKATPNSPIASLSGGNQQRVMLALLPALCAGILLEQPTRGLDVASARAIWGRLLARRESGAAVVFSSADLDEVLERSDQVLVFFGGRISRPIPRQDLNEARLAELIGGVGFDEVALSTERGGADGS
ncbi:MAG: ATP-binding cassette domain-containing protein [Roseiflexaceae bacterium]